METDSVNLKIGLLLTPHRSRTCGSREAIKAPVVPVVL
jgi:hypothetical protein